MNNKLKKHLINAADEIVLESLDKILSNLGIDQRRFVLKDFVIRTRSEARKTGYAIGHDDCSNGIIDDSVL